MGALANAVALLENDQMRKWCMAASVYQARVVITELDTTPDHAVRLKMADAVVTNPDLITGRLVNVICTDPDVATKGTTPTEVTESLVLSKTAAVWTSLAKLMFPAVV